jgi:two-component system, OmpR family, sensor histidine kinase KdpD
VRRVPLALAGVAIVTFIGYRVVPVNATTIGFAYLLLVLMVASTWGFAEAAIASVAATLTFNLFFLPPIGKLTIYDPQNWVAMFTFLTTGVIGSRLSVIAKRRAQDAIERRQDVERLYTFSRSLLLIDDSQPFGKQLIQQLAEVFQLKAAVLYERHTGAIYRAGPAEFDGLDDQLRDAALHNSTFSDAARQRLIMAVRLGSQPIGSIGLQGISKPDSVLQGIGNLIAIGLERSKAQDLTHQIEAARQSEQLRTTLIDAMAHELKTPLTSIKAATTALLAGPDQAPESRSELLKIADEEAEHLTELIDDAVEMARLDSAQINVQREMSDPRQIVREAVEALRREAEDREVEIHSEIDLPPVAVDRRLLTLALKQILDNALKYSPQDAPVTIRVREADAALVIEIVDRGEGIPLAEQSRIFDRFYRSPSVKHQIPGSGLGLSIAHSIARAHNGDLTVASRPGETTFRMVLPLVTKEDLIEHGAHTRSG